MRSKYTQLSYIIGSAIIIYFLAHFDSPHFQNLAYSETSEILNLSKGIINSTFPQIKTLDDIIYVIWSGNAPHGINEQIQSDVFVTKSENKGNGFEGPINLSNNSGSSFNPQSEISSNNMYVVWEDDTYSEIYDQDANTSVLFRQSKDNGTTFSPTVPLSSIDRDSTNPDITTINGNTAFVVWQDNSEESSKILSKKNTSEENAFSDQQIISEVQENNFEIHPKIITSNGTINIVWVNFSPKDENSRILKRSSIDGGSTFGHIMQLSNDSEFAINEKNDAYGNDMYIVWQGDNKGQFDIFLSRSSDGGNTFGQPINLSNESGDSINPNLIALNNNTFVIWNDNSTKNYNVMIKRSSDGGNTFGQPINLSNSTESDSTNPQLAATANELYVVWQGDNKGQFDIFLSRSSDGGNTFGQPINLSNSTESDSTNPQLAATANELYVVWQEDLSGNNQIYFIKVDSL